MIPSLLYPLSEPLLDVLVGLFLVRVGPQFEDGLSNSGKVGEYELRGERFKLRNVHTEGEDNKLGIGIRRVNREQKRREEEKRERWIDWMSESFSNDLYMKRWATGICLRSPAQEDEIPNVNRDTGALKGTDLIDNRYA